MGCKKSPVKKQLFDSDGCSEELFDSTEKLQRELGMAGNCGGSRYHKCCTLWIYRKAWREANPELANKNNVRDFATVNELTILSNLETHNAQMIREGKAKNERFDILKEIALINSTYVHTHGISMEAALLGENRNFDFLKRSSTQMNICRNTDGVFNPENYG